MLKNFRFLLESGEVGMKMERMNISKYLMKKVRIMGSLFIGMKMELKLENGIIKMV